jgi:hypothetical protein
MEEKIIIPIVSVVHSEILFHKIVRTVDKISKQIMEDHLWVNILISLKSQSHFLFATRWTFVTG